MNKKNLLDRFCDKIVFSPHPNCWVWSGAKLNTNGYGVIRINKKNELAHRVSYIIHIGPIKDGLWVLHKCDNRSCVNPGHLFLGTRTDNVNDMYKKGRGAKPNLNKTHCPKGHGYFGDNLYNYKRTRNCKKCKIDNQRIRRSAA
jgi:hypothetical protein